MLFPVAKVYQVIRVIPRSHFRKIIVRRYHTSKSAEPLRILFCGSDEFSIASLRAIHQAHLEDPGLISSIDVVCKQPKLVGRGLKTVREVPIKAVAEELSLPLHQINTFTKWDPPRPKTQLINLIIAVSFGLFVPPRILTAAKYGGLNVHPSLLPDLRGAAPLHHTLLQARKTIGVSVQTLHPQHFDHGTILAQTPYPGYAIPSSSREDNHNVADLVSFIAPKGAAMLLEALKNRVFVPPLTDVGWASTSHFPDALNDVQPAPKITPEDRRVDWHAWDASHILLRSRVIGPLWSTFALSATKEEGSFKRRVIFNSMALKSDVQAAHVPSSPGIAFWSEGGASGAQDVCMSTCDGRAVRLGEVTLEGKNRGPAHRVLTGLMREGQPLVFDR